MVRMVKVFGLAVLLFFVIVSTTNAAEYNLKFQSANVTGDNFWKIQEQWVKNVEVMSGGRIKIQLLPIGSLVAWNETLDAVGTGLLQGHITGPNYFTGKDPAFAMMGDLTAAWDSGRLTQMFMEYGGGLEIYNEIISEYNVHCMAAGGVGLESIPSTKPIRSLDDFKGLKMRLPAGIGHKIFADIGVSPVNLPTSETYTAMERGVIDATDYSMISTNKQVGFYRFSKYAIYPGFHSVPNVEFSINKDIWEKMDDSLRLIMTVSARDTLRNWHQSMDIMDLEAVRQLKEEGKVEIVALSEEELKKFRQIAQKRWAEMAKESPNAQKVYDTVVKFLKDMDKI